MMAFTGNTKSLRSLEIVQYTQQKSFESCICQDVIMTELSGKNYVTQLCGGFVLLFKVYWFYIGDSD